METKYTSQAGKKVLVTGGTGYIGSHTVVELIEDGFEVIIIDDLSNSNHQVLENIKQITGVSPLFYQFNLCDNSKLTAFFEKHNDIDVIVHFAAFKAVNESVAEPLKYYSNNLESLINILKGMEKYDIPNLVFSSSCTVYGQPDVLPVTEHSPFKKAASPYGNTKRISEEIMEDALKANKNLKGIALRYFNPIGAHKSALIGELPKGTPNNLMPFITQTAAGIRKELQVFGNDYDTHDGTCIRDFIHVVDLAKAHVIASKRLLTQASNPAFEFFNLGTGIGYSVLDVIQSFEKSTQQKLKYRIAERRAGDVEKIYADTTLANQELGWKAEKSLDDMTLSAWNWEVYLREQKSVE